MDAADRFTEDTSIGVILRKCPESEDVFRRHFGEDCFSNAGSKLETVSFGAAMHDLDAGPIVRELNQLLEVRLSGRRR